MKGYTAIILKRNAAMCEKKISRTYDLLSRTYDLLSRTYDLISRTYDLLCHTYDLLSRTYDLISCTYDLLSRTYDLLSRTYDLICRTYDLLSRTYDLSSIYTASIMAHRVVNYVKSEADNQSVFLLMVKTTKYLEYILHIFLNIFKALESPDHI